ncbi:V-type proton ATPase subunit E-like isoform X2 [Cimex lectularius]|uniref:Uncharacterized protein n=1 Tax=Cimex lectularius TaxID=79782 RepID=A0A8I6S5Y9_CIMLE|nr:V-type proton ATPase subunit E-like isoform X2 [Cimex lectularius]
MAKKVNKKEEIPNELRSILLHIMQDCAEKLEEIEVCCEEEFRLERCKEIFHHMALIDAKYKKKMEQRLKIEAIEHSRMKNMARLKLLSKKEECFLEVVKSAKDSLKTGLDPNSHNYKTLLKKLILQGLCKLCETSVKIRCRGKDKQAVTDVMNQACVEFEALSKIKTTLKIDKKTSLPDNSYGGVIMVTENNKIMLNNSLGWKLEDVGRKMLPEMCKTLYNPEHDEEELYMQSMPLTTKKIFYSGKLHK